jgi:hypothetical protein
LPGHCGPHLWAILEQKLIFSSTYVFGVVNPFYSCSLYTKMNTQFYNLYNSTAPFNKEILKDEIPTDFYEQ